MRVRYRNRWTSVLKVGVVFGLLTGAQIAQAQFEPRISGRPGEEHIRSGVGVAVQGGGGITNFTGGSETGLTDLGGTWDVRAVVGTRTIPALEAAYVGSARGVSDGVASGTGLVGNGLEAAFRLNLPFLQNETLIEPFGFLGLGWSHYNLTGVGDLDLGARSNDVGVVPMGLGLAVGHRGFIAEARFTYRPAFQDDNLVLGDDGGAFDLDTWNFGVMLGYEF
jgi:hypothetical protein